MSNAIKTAATPTSTPLMADANFPPKITSVRFNTQPVFPDIQAVLVKAETEDSKGENDGGEEGRTVSSASRVKCLLKLANLKNPFESLRKRGFICYDCLWSMLRLSWAHFTRQVHGENYTVGFEIDCLSPSFSTRTGNTEETRWTHVISIGTKGAYDATIYLPSQDGVHANLFVPPHLVDTRRHAKMDSSLLTQGSYRRHPSATAKGSLADQQKIHDEHSALVVREVGQALNGLWLKARHKALVELKEKISLEDLEEFLGLRNVNKTGAMVELAMLANEIAIASQSLVRAMESASSLQDADKAINTIKDRLQKLDGKYKYGGIRQRIALNKKDKAILDDLVEKKKKKREDGQKKEEKV